MATPEHHLHTGEGEQQAEEVLDPRHFYAAYIFDNAETRLSDVTTLLEQAQELESPVRYWWLSEAMDLQDSADRLIVCVHHPAESEEAGMDLYDALKDRQVTWDELEPAAVDEYRELGKSIKSPNSIYEPDGISLFPESETTTEALYILTREDLQTVAEDQLGRKLSVEEVGLNDFRRIDTLTEAMIESYYQKMKALFDIQRIFQMSEEDMNYVSFLMKLVKDQELFNQVKHLLNR